jgi:hypothetical protein
MTGQARRGAVTTEDEGRQRLAKFDAEVSGRPAPGDWEGFFAQVGPGHGRD